MAEWNFKKNEILKKQKILKKLLGKHINVKLFTQSFEKKTLFGKLSKVDEKHFYLILKTKPKKFTISSLVKIFLAEIICLNDTNSKKIEVLTKLIGEPVIIHTNPEKYYGKAYSVPWKGANKLLIGKINKVRDTDITFWLTENCQDVIVDLEDILAVEKRL